MKEEAKHTELIDLTIKKMANEASAQELLMLEELLIKDSHNQKLFNEVEQTWSLSEKARGISSEETEQEWQKLNSVISAQPDKVSKFSFLRIAAVISFLLASSVAVFIYINNPAISELEAYQHTEKQLKDGSTIALHSGSFLSYSDDFNQEKREVTLTGEAFFDISRDEKKPFIIHALNTEIQVLGTSFNVKAIKGDKTTEVVVVTGKVKITHLSKSITLEPGEKGLINRKTGQLYKLQNDDPNFISWHTKDFQFSDLPLEYVVNLLNEVFEKDLYFANEQLKACPVTVSFENQSFDSILKILSGTLDFKVEKTSTGLEISGRGCQ